MPYDCPHCSKPIDEVVPLKDHTDAKKKLKTEREEADARYLEAEKKLKSLSTLEADLTAARATIERTARVEATREAGGPTSASHLRHFSRAYDDYVGDAKATDAKAETMPYAEWIKADTGARADDALKGWFAAPAAAQAAPATSEATPAAPTAPKAPQAPPKPSSEPPAAPPAPPAPPSRAKSMDEIDAAIQNDTLYQGHKRALASAVTPADKAAAANAARARMAEIQKQHATPPATP